MFNSISTQSAYDHSISPRDEDVEVKSVLIFVEKCLIPSHPNSLAAQDHSISPKQFTLIS
jgi:hypothetical protein